MDIANQEYNFNGKTHIMGILNVTPNSFSDGGKFETVEAAVIHAKKMVEDGADIIDVGGESTHPRNMPITLDEELSRVIPIIEVLSKEIEVPISIDTYKSEVAKEAISVGAKIINDVTGGNGDTEMYSVAARLDVPIILMQNREVSTTAEIISDLQEIACGATTAGVSRDKIILDPGFGFRKSVDLNLALVREMESICKLGYPVLLGASRKGTLSKLLNLPKEDLVEATIAANLSAISKGCQIVRVHDVKEMYRALQMWDAINKG